MAALGPNEKAFRLMAVKVPPELRADLEELARVSERTLSGEVRKALRLYVTRARVEDGERLAA